MHDSVVGEAVKKIDEYVAEYKARITERGSVHPDALHEVNYTLGAIEMASIIKDELLGIAKVIYEEDDDKI